MKKFSDFIIEKRIPVLITISLISIFFLYNIIKLRDFVVEFQTVNGTPPIGICGSGMLDAIAELCQMGFISRQGLLESGPGVRQVGTTREFILVPSERSGTHKDITITQSDIRKIQLAKAAIRTGIDTLLDEMGIVWEELEEA